MSASMPSGTFVGERIESIPQWYLARVLGDTTNDGLRLSDFSTIDRGKIQIEIMKRSDSAWNSREVDQMAASALRFAASGGYATSFQVSEEEVDLGGADENAAVLTVGNMIPATSVLLGLVCRCTESFAGDIDNFDLGDETTQTRFAKDSTRIVLGDETVWLMNWVTDDDDKYPSAIQTAATKLSILLNDAATAGKLRLKTLYVTFV